jgi:toxin ParE1/3/4
MLQIRWKPSARTGLAKIITRIAQENPDAAQRMRDLIEGCILPAAEHPKIFRTGRVRGTREVIAHPNYILVYREHENCIEVVKVMHARQMYP